jgi:hypothetical protein
MNTLAAEGIELPIATDHNVHIDHRPFAHAMDVSRYFTAVIGNEVTTNVGHFNVFPVAPGAPPPAHDGTRWDDILNGIYATPEVKVAILKHARDLHGGVRPFGPKLFNESVGESLEERNFRFNGMEVLNSSATQNDIMRLFHDWMALLNGGYHVTPVDSSDSHDVSRHFVGQGRTYIRCSDQDPGNINVDAAVEAFVRGQVLVSYGLMVELTVDGKYRSGETATVPNEAMQLRLRILGPHWISADGLILFANGHPLREIGIARDERDGLPAGVIWEGQWEGEHL